MKLKSFHGETEWAADDAATLQPETTKFTRRLIIYSFYNNWNQ